MVDNQIKVNNLQELINQIKIWVEKQGGTEKVKIVNIGENSGSYAFKNSKAA